MHQLLYSIDTNFRNYNQIRSLPVLLSYQFFSFFFLSLSLSCLNCNEKTPANGGLVI